MLHKLQETWAQAKPMLVSIRATALTKLAEIAGKVGEHGRSLLWTVLSVIESCRPHLQPYDSTMGHVYIRDFRTFMFPYRNHNNPDYRITAHPTDTAEAIEKILGEQRGDDLVRAVEDFMEDLSQRLLIWYKTFFLIENGTDGKELKLLAGNTYSFGFFYVHFVSRKHAEDARIRGIEPRPQFFRKRDVFVFKLPKSVASKRQQRRIVRALINASKLQPAFAKSDLDKQKIEDGYSFTEYHRALMIELLVATKPLGMNMHSMLDKLGTGYYDVILATRFYRALAELRDGLVHQINELLAQCSIEGKIKITGLPIATEMDKISLELEEGKIDFAEAWKRMRI